MSSLIPTFAYLDPGTGAILLQILVAGLATVAILFRRIILTPLAWFTKPTNPGEETDEGHSG